MQSENAVTVNLIFIKCAIWLLMTWDVTNMKNYKIFSYTKSNPKIKMYTYAYEYHKKTN